MKGADDQYRYWTEPPPEPTERCVYWVLRFLNGFVPNRRISMMSYTEAAGFYKVYLWEYLNIIAPLERSAAATGETK